MQELLTWTLEKIRNEGSSMSWMEEKRLEWVPLIASRLASLLDGKAFVLLCDDNRAWFEHYILMNINKTNTNRPLLPFVSLKALYPNLDYVKQQEDLKLLKDMLCLTFPDGYIFFYIGKGNDVKSQIAKSEDTSFLWLLDEQIQNSFHLSSLDENLDIKLIQLFKLMDKTIDALLFAEVEIKND